MNKKYWYRVRSYNWAGGSMYSDPRLVNDAPPPAPALNATSDQPHQFAIQWTKTSDDILSIKIERAPDHNGIPGAWIQIAEPTIYCGLVPTDYTDIGIPTGQTFWYRVRAVNRVGDSPYSNTGSATEATPALSVPIPAQILSLLTTNNDVFIRWSTAGVVEASGNIATGYTNISPVLVIGGSGDQITNYFDPGALTNSPSRFYRIHSEKSTGAGE